MLTRARVGTYYSATLVKASHYLLYSPFFPRFDAFYRVRKRRRMTERERMRPLEKERRIGFDLLQSHISLYKKKEEKAPERRE
jgi:hypothetical protein